MFFFIDIYRCRREILLSNTNKKNAPHTLTKLDLITNEKKKLSFLYLENNSNDSFFNLNG